MLFPVSGVETSPFLPPLAAFVVSLLTSMGGVSGAFLLLPFQVSVLGCANPSASSTNLLFNIIATPGGIARYFREGRLFLPLALVLSLAGLPGVVLGAYIRLEWLAEPGSFKLFAALVLLFLGGRLAIQAFSEKGKAPPPGRERPEFLFTSVRSLSFRFQGQVHNVPVLPVFLLSLGIGIIGGVYGIGGGSFLAPILVSFFALPVHIVAGPTLFSTLVTSLAGMLSFLFLAPYYPELTVRPDWALGLLFGLGGLLGMYTGARLQKRVAQRPITILLAVIVTGTALSWLLPFFFA